MAWLWYVFAIAAGISNPLQSGSNSALLKGTGAPIVAAFLVYAIGVICLLAGSPFLGVPLRASLSKLYGLPWWVLLGGVCNAVFLLASLTVTKRLGSATFTTLVVVSALVTAIALDHFGLMGFEIRPASHGRLFGGALAIAGVVFIALF